MDPAAAAQAAAQAGGQAAVAPTGVAAWVNANGNVTYFFAQIAFWIIVAFAAIWAAWAFNRYVSFMMSGTEPGSSSENSDEDDIAVDEFVE